MIGLIHTNFVSIASTFRFSLLLSPQQGFGVGGLTVPFDTLSEMLPTNCRGRNLLYIEFFWTFGTLSVPLLAYLTLNPSNSEGSGWPLFVILCSIPCIVSTILGILLVPESPRWLLEHNPTPERCEQALVTLRIAATRNGHDPLTLFPDGTHLTAENVHEKHHRDDSDINTTTTVNTNSGHDDNTPFQSSKNHSLSLPNKKRKQHNHSNSLTELFSPAWRRITLLLWGAWFGLGFLYYGVILAVSIVFTVNGREEVVAANDDDNDDGSAAAAVTVPAYDFDYVAIFISASAEIFGLFAVSLTIDSWGRINSQSLSYIAGGVSCLLLGLGAHFGFVRPALIALAFLSRMAMMASSCTTWVSTSEILATEIRATGHGAANAMARLGGFLCPYFITEGNSPAFIGVLVFVMAVITSACSYNLPETAGRAMGDVLDDDDEPTNNTDSRKSKGEGDNDGGLDDGEAATSYQII
jgi:Sugar (and other) transporter